MSPALCGMTSTGTRWARRSTPGITPSDGGAATGPVCRSPPPVHHEEGIDEANQVRDLRAVGFTAACLLVQTMRCEVHCPPGGGSVLAAVAVLAAVVAARLAYLVVASAAEAVALTVFAA